MAASPRAARLTRLAIVLLCTLVGVSLRGFVAWETPALDQEQRVIAAGAHLLQHGDTEVTAFEDDAPLAAFAASLPWLGVLAGVPPRDAAGPPEQVGWTALHGTRVHPWGTEATGPRELIPTRTLLLGARAPSLFAAFLAILATVLLAEFLLGRWAALVAGLVIALDPLTVVSGGLALADPWAQAATAWLLLAAAAHWETIVGGTDRRPGRERRSALALGAACGFAVLASVTVWPVVVATMLWLHLRAGAATRRGDAFRRGRSGRLAMATIACTAIVALGCLALHWRVLVQPAENVIRHFDGVAGEAFRNAAVVVAWPAAFALVATFWLFRDRADQPALLVGAAVAAVAMAVVAPGRLVLPALAAASPAIAVMAGCGVARAGHRIRPLTAAFALLLLVPLGTAALLRISRFPPEQPADNIYAEWFIARYVEQRRPQTLHVARIGVTRNVEIRESTRVLRAPWITAPVALSLVAEDGVAVALPHPIAPALEEHVVARGRGLWFLAKEDE